MKGNSDSTESMGSIGKMQEKSGAENLFLCLGPGSLPKELTANNALWFIGMCQIKPLRNGFWLPSVWMCTSIQLTNGGTI